MVNVAYSFCVLRYMHDPVTQEFANIGVALYSKEARYLNATCTTNYGRITRMFESIDGYRFRQATRYIQDRIQELGQDLSTGLPFESGAKIEQLLSMVLPPDDSAFQFSPAGVGVSQNLDGTVKDLYSRFVDKYSSSIDSTPRDDDEVWKVYREPLERRRVIPYLNPKKIVAPNFDYQFERAWKNQIWRVYEPVSFDLIEPTSILDKANRWLGRATNLFDSEDKFKMYLLLGEPQDATLKSVFIKAQNILHKIPGDPELIRENEAEEFAEELAKEIEEHDRDLA